MRKLLETFTVLCLFGLTFIACYGSYKSHNFNRITTTSLDSPMRLDEAVYLPIPDEGEPMSDVPLVRTSAFVNLTFEEQDELMQIAMSEARGEGSLGMAYVMRVVLNRSLRNNQSIHEVIYAPGQFYVAGMGMTPSEECAEALAMVMDGWDESQGAIYFCARGYSKYGEPLFQYGNHYFSK